MEWEGLLNQALGIIIPAASTLIAAWFAYLANKLKNAYQEKINNETAQAVVRDVVQFVEQVYGDIKGPEKLQKAISQASSILQGKGINITDAEINMLIESAVYGINEGLTKEKQEKQVSEDVKEIAETSEDIKDEIKEDGSEG